MAMPSSVLPAAQACQDEEDRPDGRSRRSKGRLRMEATPSFCAHPEDVDGCCQALVQAWREVRVQDHCLVDGLKEGYPQCRDVLVGGLRGDVDPWARGEGRLARDGEPVTFRSICETALLAVYPRAPDGACEVLAGAYEKMIRAAAYRLGITRSGDPLGGRCPSGDAPGPASAAAARG